MLQYLGGLLQCTEASFWAAAAKPNEMSALRGTFARGMRSATPAEAAPPLLHSSLFRREIDRSVRLRVCWPSFPSDPSLGGAVRRTGTRVAVD
ncbi:hypothetical protein BS78_06G023900 [Paspalum vaginatum]|nr:hypothetical protein BS78_06G023900 [Paspalum vaginatum]